MHLLLDSPHYVGTFQPHQKVILIKLSTADSHEYSHIITDKDPELEPLCKVTVSDVSLQR